MGYPISAWLWGHEHRVGVYESQPADRVLSGQCLGHATMPEMGSKAYVFDGEVNHHRFDPIYTPELVKVYDNQDGIYNGGFAMLEVRYWKQKK